MKIGKFKKEYLFVLGLVIFLGVTFVAIQIIQASPGTATTGSKPTPVGHTWNEIANFSCPAGECLISNSAGTLTCATCGGGSLSLTQTYQSCSWTGASAWYCTATCPAGYTRTGCSAGGIATIGQARYIFYLRATPSGSDSCQCYCRERQDGSSSEYYCSAGECFAYCAKIQ